jgi:hypothetical protein
VCAYNEFYKCRIHDISLFGLYFGHAQDVVINLPASQSASSQPGSSVVFGFLGVLIVIVVLIVAVVYFKRVR